MMCTQTNSMEIKKGHFEKEFMPAVPLVRAVELYLYLI